MNRWDNMTPRQRWHWYRNRDIIRMFRAEGMKKVEIARHFGLTSTTIADIIYRAKDRASYALQKMEKARQAKIDAFIMPPPVGPYTGSSLMNKPLPWHYSSS